MLKDLVTTYLKWGVKASKYWSSYGMVIAGPNSEYYFSIADALFVGTEEDGDDYWTLYHTFKDKYIENQISYDVQQFDTYWQKANNQTAEAVYPSGVLDSILGSLLNKTMAENTNMVDDMIDNMWLFGCFANPERPCMTIMQFLQTWPRDDNDVADTAIPRYGTF